MSDYSRSLAAASARLGNRRMAEYEDADLARRNERQRRRLNDLAQFRAAAARLTEGYYPTEERPMAASADASDISPSRAYERADALLQEQLTATQLARYRQSRSFWVVGSCTGGRYQINSVRDSAVYVEATGGYKCAVIDRHMPLPDQMLTLKMMIEHDEMTFLSIAH